MSLSTARRSAMLLAVMGILLSAALAWATQARAATLYACVKKNGNAHIYAKKPKCKKGESKLSWNTAGPAGSKGAGGVNGANGTNGVSGTNGQDLTSHTPLPGGQSESGWFAVGGGSSTSGEIGVGLSFSQPLATGLKEGHVVFNAPEATSTHCPGPGRAERGFLCLYASEESHVSGFHAFGPPPFESESTGAFGAAAYWVVKALGSFVDGSWTLTAP
jgi:hypothetical protein